MVALCTSGEKEGRIYNPVKDCLLKGADPNAEYRRGRPVFSLMVYIGYRRIVELLIEFGADVNARVRSFNLKRRTVPVLHLTVPGMECGVAAALLSFGAEVDAEDENGSTAVFKAVKLTLDENFGCAAPPSAGARRYIATLLHFGADLHKKDKSSGMSAYDIAERDGKGDFLALAAAAGRRGLPGRACGRPVRERVRTSRSIGGKNKIGRSADILFER